MNCPRCQMEMKKAIAFNEQESEFWYECTNPKCNTYVNSYQPQPHQAAVHSDDHTFVGNFGGYGTGKTLTSRQELYKHLFLTPNANILICANIAAQYEQTIKRDLEGDIPKAFIANYSTQKSYIDFINGARIMFRPLDDPDKLRSLNLSMFIIVEASETNGETFAQLKTRLRNLAAAKLLQDAQGNIVYEEAENGALVPIVLHDWRRGIIESNPDAGWIRTDLLYVSEDVIKHGKILDEYTIPADAKDPAISSHIASTNVNAYLPRNFIQENSKNKPAWWINRYLYGSFSYSEGMVYPSAQNCIVEKFEIPKHWKRIIAADYGLSDNFCYLFGAIDESDGIVYIYKEVVTSNRNIEELARMYHTEAADIPQGGLYCSPLLDPKSGAKRDYNKKTLYDHFLDYNIAFQPGHIQIDARIYRTNTYLESGRLKIMDNCVELISELNDYKFPPKRLDATGKAQDKPMDKNNHCINPMEWICMALPADPKKLYYGVYDSKGNDLTKMYQQEEQRGIPWQLQEEPSYDSQVFHLFEGGDDW